MKATYNGLLNSKYFFTFQIYIGLYKYSKNKYNYLDRSNKNYDAVAAQEHKLVTVNATVLDSISTRGNKIFKKNLAAQNSATEHAMSPEIGGN